MGGRDYPDDFGTPSPMEAAAERGKVMADAIGGVTEPELTDEEEYQRGYNDGWDAGRIAAMNQGSATPGTLGGGRVRYG